MSNKQNSASNLIDDWQKQIQECLNDPRAAELIMDYYGKFQKNIQDAAQKFADQGADHACNDPVFANKLDKRVEELEARVEVLEKLLGRIFK
jgi:hypothetical protein